jgi:hypothetical protein
MTHTDQSQVMTTTMMRYDDDDGGNQNTWNSAIIPSIPQQRQGETFAKEGKRD